MGIFNRAWQGKEKLWKVFWGGFLLPYLLMVCIAIVGIGIARGKGVAFDRDAFSAPFKHTLSSVIFFGYYLWVGICVWRCRKNAKGELGGILAVILMGIILLSSGSSLIGTLLKGSTSSTSVEAAPHG
jgi:hypothetical protein